MARNDPTIYMRIPQELKDRLDQAAATNRKSLTAEVVSRLEASFQSSTTTQDHIAARDRDTYDQIARLEARIRLLTQDSARAQMQLDTLMDYRANLEKTIKSPGAEELADLEARRDEALRTIEEKAAIAARLESELTFARHQIHVLTQLTPEKTGAPPTSAPRGTS